MKLRPICTTVTRTCLSAMSQDRVQSLRTFLLRLKRQSLILYSRLPLSLNSRLVWLRRSRAVDCL